MIGAGNITEDLYLFMQKFKGKSTNGHHSSAQVSTSNSSVSRGILALNNVTFSIKKGESIGIIGKNGAGKSTLLKILSRITAPTRGKIRVMGKIASLLEVGTGFHPELTGRENIYLNAAIIGMRRAEVKAKFDEIVSFSGIETFIDTPVKRYSSGMYVRLAFAVSAHLETDILLVDEVLAVGDYEFQRKCLGKMGDIAREGRTVLFVSHNLQAVRTLTERTLWLKEGVLFDEGRTNDILKNYIAQGYRNQLVWSCDELNNKPLQITHAEVSSIDGFLDIQNEISFKITYTVREKISGAVVSIIIHAPDGSPILSSEDIDCEPELLAPRVPGSYLCEVKIPPNLLSSGKYLLRLHSGVVFQEIFDDIEALYFEIIETGNPKIRQHKQAYILPYLSWARHPLS